MGYATNREFLRVTACETDIDHQIVGLPFRGERRVEDFCQVVAGSCHSYARNRKFHLQQCGI